jgi:hypothetical protein
MTMTVHELACGCENTEGSVAVSFCGPHADWQPVSEPLYRCGECGFASTRFDRLERHVYRVHLGAQVA